ncbi:portal protein [Escherichia phage Halfdan]|uniref:Portal protein n=1 Tax=Escherichia phage Halfdan TaxID=2234092 RepID=A0A2Z5H4C7_9CAUD|nr:portal protein [Escherichia phage Halfdan]AXC34274.1 portal protein [Escherichia phage Halfdan]
MPNVSFIRPELAAVMPLYKKIRDCLSGSDKVKAAGVVYLPMPNEADKSPENIARYKGYKGRAVFYNVARRTLAGLSGQVFARDPVSEIPDALDIVEIDATGTGVSAAQQAKRLLNYALGYARGGIYVDYPNTGEEGATKKELDAGHLRPTITVCDPNTVVNWRTIQVGAKTLLSLVVIAESWPFYDDGFEIKHGCQFRVMSLEYEADENGNVVGETKYKVEIYREKSPTVWNGDNIPKNKSFELKEGPFYPTGPDGSNIQEIPFMFVGSENNDTSVDNPPFIDLCELNLAHYRNSADYEEACYVMGQPTYWFSGLTEEWMKNVLGGQIKLGSWGGVALPPNAQGGLLQMQPNTMPFEAMGHKENQMVALGAKLVEQKSVQRTATEAQQDEAAESSFLAATAKNVSAAFEWAFGWCAFYMGLDESKIVYQLNTDFDLMKLSAADRAETIKEWQGGALTFAEMRAVLRKGGVATEDDAEAKKKIDQEQADQIAATAKAMGEDPAASNPQPSNVGNGG